MGMRPNAYILSFIVCSALYLSVSCTSIGNGKAVKVQEKAADKITLLQNKIDENSAAKLEQAAVFAAGTDYALNKVQDPPKEVEVAKDMNQRVMSITGTPVIDELKRIYSIVDGLLSQLKLEKDVAKASLNVKDQEISKLQSEGKDLEKSLKLEIEKYKKANMDLARQADAVSNEFGEFKSSMNSWFGLGAIGYGLKTLIIRLAWIIGGFGLIFIVLRIFAASNPIVGAIFSVFEAIASLAINTIKGLVPGSVKFANLVPVGMFNEYKNVVEKMVDKIEMLSSHEKEVSKTLSQQKMYTLQDLKQEFSKEFGDTDKKLIETVKENLSWK